MARASEIIKYLEEICLRSKDKDPDIKLRELERALEWSDLMLGHSSSEDDADCYCE